MDNSPIIIADDDVRFRRAVALRLEQHGYSVLCAGDGEAAIALAKDNAPSLLILDVHMPGKNGLAALKKIDQHPQLQMTPVIYVTGDQSEETLATALRGGAWEVLHKPIDMNNLLEAVRCLIGTPLDLAERRSIHAADTDRIT